jgi:hypothetical protein
MALRAEHFGACQNHNLNIIGGLVGTGLKTPDADAAACEWFIRLQGTNLVLSGGFQAGLRRHVPEIDIEWESHFIVP